jgi:Mg2+ and Co2+ transporter CorA
VENIVENRLSKIKTKVENLVNERISLLSKLGEQEHELASLKVALVEKQQIIDNLKNNGKEESVISEVSMSNRLEGGQYSNHNNNEKIKKEIETMITDIDQCIKIICDKI